MSSRLRITKLNRIKTLTHQAKEDKKNNRDDAGYADYLKSQAKKKTAKKSAGKKKTTKKKTAKK